MHKPNAKDQTDMMKLIEAGNVVPVIDRQYPLQDVAEAMRYFGEGQHQGKIIIQVS
ncbi:hypothetical protein D3C71_2115270 [compost metagenome]